MTPARGIPAPHLVAAALCLGLAASLGLRAESVLLAPVALGLAGLGVVARRGRAAWLALAFLLVGLWWGSLRLSDLNESDLVAEVGEAALARAEVTGPARTGMFALRVPVRVRSWDGRMVDEASRLELPLGRAPPQGAVLELIASAREPRAADEDERFDERAYLRRQGVHVVLRADRYRVVGKRGGVGAVADGLRRHVARTMAPGLEGERRAVVAGIVLGEDERLDPELSESFRASGLYHLLAVSGQNVAYVVAGALLLAWLIGLPRWAGHVGALMCVSGYVMAVGWQPSVVRAGVAGILASLAWLAARPADRWYFLLVGAALLQAVNPYAVLEPGFQLSFAAVAAIFLVVPRLERRFEGYPLPKRAVTVLALSSACGMATAPILWLHFGTIPVYSVLANAMAEPVIAPLLGFGLACSAFASLVPAAAVALAWVNGWLAAYLAWCARTVGGLPGSQVESETAVVAFLAACLLAFALVRLPRPRRQLLLFVTAAALAGVGGWAGWPRAAPPPPEGLRVTFLDVGQGDAILLQVREGGLLVDQGPPEADVAAQLDELGVRSLAALVLTHPQRDHVGGAADVLAEIDVDAVLSPLQPTASSEERAALRIARERGVPVVPAHAGSVYRLGGLRVSVLWPDGPGTPEQDPNLGGVVLLVTYGAFDLLLTADVESEGTLPLRPPPVEVLKVAHHGSGDPGLAQLLALVRPRLAVISVGENDYGHPAPETLAALAAAPGLDVRRTDQDGEVVIETDGSEFTVWQDG